MLLLTTTGASSGRRRTTPLMYVLDGEGRLLVIASNAGALRHPDWYRNLTANAGVGVEVGPETYEATAVELSGEERERAWGEIKASYPFFAEHEEKAAPRVIPVVVLEPLAG